MNAFKSGMKFEHHVRSLFLKHGFYIFNDTGGSKSRPDISIIHNGTRVNFECKTRNAFEGGGQGLHVQHGRLVSHDTFFESILGGINIWDGRIPQFKLGNKDFDVWINERLNFRDVWVDIDSKSVAVYYARRGIHYIIIQDTGIFHTGEDPMNIGCPYFECRNRIRIRCKRHSSSSMPSTVQASLTYSTKELKKYTLLKSTYGTDGRIR